MDELPKKFQTIKEQYPEYFELYEALTAAAKDSGPVDKRTGHLIQLASAAAVHSEEAVHYYTRLALEEGISIEEIRHSMLLTINIVGLPTAMKAIAWINDMVDE